MLLQIQFPQPKRLEIYSGPVPVKRAATAPAPATEADGSLKRFDAQVPIELAATKEAMAVTAADGTVTDYRNVTIKGYLSTWGDPATLDRDGEYVLRGAFEKVISKFMRNPVMLRDHSNRTGDLVGRFTKMQEDSRGLYIEALLSNAPDVQSCRWKVAEGFLKTMSMGGIWVFSSDRAGIPLVEDLFEGSLTPIPSNPDALIQTRALTDEERKFYKSHGTLRNFDLLQSHVQQNHAGLAAT